MKSVVVNATALDKSGALSILRQFVTNIPSVTDLSWILFVDQSVDLAINRKDIKIIKQVKKSLHKRFLWDIFGLNRWIRSKGIDPVLRISLQNTGFRLSKKNTPQIIYYHQPIPFYQQKWNPLKRRERNLAFYKYIYPWFVKLFLDKNTRIFVQLDYIKRGFIKRFNHPDHKIQVFSPSFNIPQTEKTLSLPTDKLNLFYPATNEFYKNHRILSQAMETLQDVNCYFTISPLPELSGLQNIKWLGRIPYDEVCSFYKQCDALLFPSYIETFGLPLIEAASIGMPIIAADLPYAREVLKGYEGATFVKYDDPMQWLQAIDKIEKGKRFSPIDLSERPGWNELFTQIIKTLEDNVNI